MAARGLKSWECCKYRYIISTINFYYFLYKIKELYKIFDDKIQLQANVNNEAVRFCNYVLGFSNVIDVSCNRCNRSNIGM